MFLDLLDPYIFAISICHPSDFFVVCLLVQKLVYLGVLSRKINEPTCCICIHTECLSLVPCYLWRRWAGCSFSNVYMKRRLTVMKCVLFQRPVGKEKLFGKRSFIFQNFMCFNCNCMCLYLLLLQKKLQQLLQNESVK